MYQPQQGSGSLLAEPVLVVNQRLKLVELRNEYHVYDQHGRPIGTVQQATQTPLAFLLRLFSDLDVALPITLHFLNASGQAELVLHKPWFRWVCSVRQPGGAELGTIAKQFRLGKARFALADPGGRPLGEVRAQNWRAKDFAVLDGAGVQVARVTKKWAGLRELFTDADNYVVQVDPALTDPLRSLAIASCLGVDVIMKQKDTGD
jgi:Scramblase